jgi:hypothetical protein
MSRPERITDENVLKVDIAEIAQDRRFAELQFNNAKNELPKVQKWLLEAGELGADTLLIRRDKDVITNIKKQLIERLERLLTFEIRTTNDTARQQHDELEGQIDSFYNNAYQELAMRILPFLRQETARSSSDTKELEKQQKAAAQAERKYNELSAALEKELEELKKRKEEVSASRGEVAAIGLGKYFEAQATAYSTEASGWATRRETLFNWLLWIILANLALYVFLFITDKVGVWPHLPPTEFFTIQYGLVKLALLALLSYAIGFATRNFNINAGLIATNKHRKNVAETLADTLASPLSEEAKAVLAREAATAMFQNLSVGYIKKEHQNDSGPILEIIRKISPLNGN